MVSDNVAEWSRIIESIVITSWERYARDACMSVDEHVVIKGGAIEHASGEDWGHDRPLYLSIPPSACGYNDRRRLNAYSPSSDNSSETTVHLPDGMTRSWRDVKQRRLDEGYFAAVNYHLIEPTQLCLSKVQHKDSGKARVGKVVVPWRSRTT